MSAEILYPDGKVFRGSIAKMYEDGQYSVITDRMFKRWLCDTDLTPYDVGRILTVGRPIAAVIEYSRSVKMPVPELVADWGSTKKYHYTYYDVLNRRHTVVVYTRNGKISSVYR